MNGCGNTMNPVRTAGSIAMGKRQYRHSWIPSLLQKRKCYRIATTQAMEISMVKRLQKRKFCRIAQHPKPKGNRTGRQMMS